MKKTTIPELLAPGGSEESLYAAVENGADAVYFGISGLGNLNARARAQNIPLDKLEEIVAYLHRNRAKAYLTLNTLAFSEELPTVETLLTEFERVGVDAVLVQDLGIARLARSLVPNLTLHASTQMSLTSVESFTPAKEMGIQRVVLPRELSLQQIRQLRENTDMELETFVHGALCISFSGQCYASLALGGRSANRGQCAQPCRLRYTLLDDASRETHLFSPTDLCALPHLRELHEAGVCSFKIEGRLKPPEYVAEVTRIYREAIDELCSSEDASVTKKERLAREKESVERLALTFSRGFSSGWLEGVKPRTLVPGDIQAHRGIALGKVIEIRRDEVLVQLCAPVHRGDGVLFENANDPELSQGGRVYEIFRKRESVTQAKSGENVLLSFGNGVIDLAALEPNQEIRKTSDSRLEKEVNRNLQRNKIQREKNPDASRVTKKTPLHLRFHGEIGKPLRVETANLTLESETPMELAKKHPLNAEVLQEQFSRLGETPFTLEMLDAHLDGKGMLPLSVLGKLRKSLVAALLENAERNDSCDTPIPARAKGISLAQLRAKDRSWTESATDHEDGNNVAHLLLRNGNPLQDAAENPKGFSLQRCIEAGCRSVYLELTAYKDYERGAETLRAKGLEFIAVAPRVFKPGDHRFLKFLAELKPEAVLVRNLGALRYFLHRGISCIGDFSLNLVNELSLREAFELSGFAAQKNARLLRITPGYDLDAKRLERFLNLVPANLIELIVQGRMPLFTMEHCVWKANLIDENQPCERLCHTRPLKVRDRYGAIHTLRSDIHCRNILENSSSIEHPQTQLGTWNESGVRHYRFEWDDRLDFSAFLNAMQTIIKSTSPPANISAIPQC